MTMPDERYRALADWPNVLREFAYQPGPVRKKELRELIRAALWHYPLPYELKQIAAKCPKLLKGKTCY